MKVEFSVLIFVGAFALLHALPAPQQEETNLEQLQQQFQQQLQAGIPSSLQEMFQQLQAANNGNAFAPLARETRQDNGQPPRFNGPMGLLRNYFRIMMEMWNAMMQFNLEKIRAKTAAKFGAIGSTQTTTTTASY